MATYRTSAFESALVRKGYVVDNTHHNMYWYYLDGKKTGLRTRTSNGEKEYSEAIFKQRREQLGDLTKEQMLDFIECRFTAEMYRAYLIENGKVNPPEDYAEAA